MARLGLTGVFVGVLSFEWDGMAMVATAVFIVASLTDWLDGYIARRMNLVSDFGKLFDPLVDKILVTAAMFYLVAGGWLPIWMAVLMVSREFLITGLRVMAAGKGTLLSAERLGKHKTISQIVAIIVTLLVASADEACHMTGGSFTNELWFWFLDQSVYWLFLWATLITVWSGLVYFKKNRHLLHGEMSGAGTDAVKPPVLNP